MQAAVRDDPSHAAGTGRTVVFAGTVKGADEVAEVLARNGVEVVLYHRKISVPEQVQVNLPIPSSAPFWPESAMMLLFSIRLCYRSHRLTVFHRMCSALSVQDTSDSWKAQFRCPRCVCASRGHKR